MYRGDNQSVNKVGPSADGLQPASHAEDDTGHAGPPAVSGQPSLHSPFNHRRAVRPDIYNYDDETHGTQGEYGSGGLSRAFQGRRELTRVQELLDCGHEEPTSQNSYRETHINQALEGVDAEGVRQRDLVFARDEERPDRFADAAKKEDGRKACQGHAKDMEEAGVANVLLEIPPAESPEKVANIDEENSG